MALIGISGKINSGKDTIGKLINFHTTGGFDTYTDLEGFLNHYDEGTDMYPFRIKKFADKLKDIVCLLLGCTREQLEDREFKEKELGEEWRIWYMTHYKLNNNKIGKIYSSEKEIIEFENSEFFKNLKLDGYIIKLEILTPRKLLQLLGTDCGRNIIHPNIWCNALFADYNNVFQNWIITDVRFLNEVEAIKKRNGFIIRVERNLEDQNDQHESEIALDKYEGFDYIVQNNGTIEELIEKIKQILIYQKIIQHG